MTIFGLDLKSYSDLAAVIGLVFAFVTIWFARKTYISSQESGKLSHMNTLFRDLLRLEFDFYNTPHPKSSDREEARQRLRAYKMWVLEEMWIWLGDYRRKKPYGARKSVEHSQSVFNWEETIKYHIRRSTETEWQEFDRAKDCYTQDFYRLVRQWNPHAAKSDAERMQCPICGQSVAADYSPA